MTDILPVEGLEQPAGIDTGTPHSARIWNYYLGGVENFAADREAAEAVLAQVPGLVAAARADRAFLGRAVRYLAREAGIRQFLDLGTGIPAANNIHEVTREIAPECRVVYVDNDPVVGIHARALLAHAGAVHATYIDADVREPGKILQAAAETLDFDEPIALMMLGVLNFVTDDEARMIVDRLLAAVTPGSYLAIAHPVTGADDGEMEETARDWNEKGIFQITLRTAEELAGFFDGLELLEPGVVSCSQWRPEPGDPDAHLLVTQFCAVGRKP